MTEWLDEQTGLPEIALDYRIKSYASSWESTSGISTLPAM